jgi:hypothetical protein
MIRLQRSLIVAAILAVLSVEALGKDAVSATPVLDELPLQQSVTQRGITWTFDKPARVGRFITGDFYVVGPVTVEAIDPTPLFGAEVKTAPEAPADTRDSREEHYKPDYARNGSTLNMPAVVARNSVTPRTKRSGFDSRMNQDAYDAGQFTKLPIAMKAGDSLVSSISAEPMDRGYAIKAVAILTCVGSPQPADAFRPSYCQTASCPQYLARNLRRDLLLNLPKPEAAAKVLPKNYAASFAVPWIDTVGYGRAMPRLPFTFYGPQIAALGGDSSLLLNLDYTPEEKEPLLLNMVQTGIDLHGLLRGGGGWPGEGGGDAGRKWIIMFAGLMLNDPKMYALTEAYPEGRFHEDEQTAFCPLTYHGKVYNSSWTGAKVVWTGHYAYYKGQFRAEKVLTHYGPVDLFPPDQWPSPWSEGSEGYRRNTTSSYWVAEALAARLMHAEKDWDHDAFFAYVDRWMTEDDAKYCGIIMKNAQDKLDAAKTPEEKASLEAQVKKIQSATRGGTISGPPEMVPIVKYLWDTYRDHMPPGPGGERTPPAESTWK